MPEPIRSFPTSVVIATDPAAATPPAAPPSGPPATPVAPGAFAAPYPLPAARTRVAIPTAGRNVANDVKPAPHTNGSWQYALFQSYGGGSFVRDYSAAGAYVLAGMGGHNAAPCFGAAIFDFTTGRWSYLPNANGFDERRTSDVKRAETNGSPYLELTAVRTGQMPSPSHHYKLQVSLPKTVSGGDRGAILIALGAAKTVEGADSPVAHRFDLATGLWTRASKNLFRDITTRTPYTKGSAAYDPTLRRVYVSVDFGAEDKLAYLDLSDGLWKSAGSYSTPRTIGPARSIWVDDRRRLLMVLSSEAQLWAIELNAVGRGPARLRTSTAITNAGRRWEEYPLADGGDGAFYSLAGDGPPYGGSNPAPRANLQAVLRLAPPAGDPITGTWEYSTVPIAGGITAQYVIDPDAASQHETRFFYVPALRCFAWIPNGSGPVELIKP
jgi:hypothetical protein